jgi:hypothetical protein
MGRRVSDCAARHGKNGKKNYNLIPGMAQLLLIDAVFIAAGGSI